MDALTDQGDEWLPPGRKVRIAAFKSGIGLGGFNPGGGSAEGEGCNAAAATHDSRNV